MCEGEKNNVAVWHEEGKHHAYGTCTCCMKKRNEMKREERGKEKVQPAACGSEAGELKWLAVKRKATIWQRKAIPVSW